MVQRSSSLSGIFWHNFTSWGGQCRALASVSGAGGTAHTPGMGAAHSSQPRAVSGPAAQPGGGSEERHRASKNRHPPEPLLLWPLAYSLCDQRLPTYPIRDSAPLGHCGHSVGRSAGGKGSADGRHLSLYAGTPPWALAGPTMLGSGPSEPHGSILKHGSCCASGLRGC